MRAECSAQPCQRANQLTKNTKIVWMVRVRVLLVPEHSAHGGIKLGGKSKFFHVKFWTETTFSTYNSLKCWWIPSHNFAICLQSIAQYVLVLLRRTQREKLQNFWKGSALCILFAFSYPGIRNIIHYLHASPSDSRIQKSQLPTMDLLSLLETV